MPVTHGREAGFALPLAMIILSIVALFVAAAIGLATHNTDRATRDALSARALAAADAGLDAAVYRMNKALVASQVQGVLGLPTAVIAESKCVTLTVNQFSVLEPVNGWCAESATQNAEQVDGGADATQVWQPATFRYSTSIGVNVGTTSAPLIQRRVVATGTAGDVQKRVMGTIHATLGSSGNLVKVFEQVGYEQCVSATPTGTDPSSGC